VEHFTLHQLPVQFIVHRREDMLCCVQHPVGHGLPGQLQPLPPPFLLLPVRCYNRARDFFDQQKQLIYVTSLFDPKLLEKAASIKGEKSCGGVGWPGGWRTILTA